MPIKKLPADEWHKNIPFGMRAVPHWIGHHNKRPVSVATGQVAKVNDPATWGSFDEAKAYYAKTLNDPASGVGFVFDGTEGMVFIDLDHVITDGKWTGPVELQALMAGASGETYTEVSPSGTGLHLFGLGTLPASTRHARKVGGTSAVEAYSGGRFSTVTGLKVGSAQLGGIGKRIAAVAAFLGAADGPGDDSPPEPERAEEVAEALSHLDPDMPYDEWVRVGMALKAGLGAAGRSLWLTWCREGQKFKPGEPEEKWRSFQKGGVGLGTLLHMAEEAGWQFDRKPRAADEFVVLTGEAGPRLDTSDLKLVTLDTVAPEKIDWLWRGRIARGHLTLVVGDPGLGKSIMTLDLAAKLSRGHRLPKDESQHAPCRVLLLNAEDGQADTIRPRAEAAGADLTHITVLDLMHGGRAPQLPNDVAAIEKYVTEVGNVELVVLDPLNACLPTRIDSHKDQHVRQALAPLTAMAMRLHIAVVVVAHLNKSSDESTPLYRISGSIGLGAAARSVLFVGPHPENEGEVVVAQAKAQQIGPQAGPSLSFRVDPSAADRDVGVVNWLDEVEVDARDMVAVKKDHPEPRGKLDQAVMWLEARLSDGPAAASVVTAEARAMGFGEKTLRLAHDKLGGTRRREGGLGADGRWLWYAAEPFKEVK